MCVVPPLICWAEEEEEEEEEEDAGPASNIEQRGRRCGCRQNGGRTHTANKTDTQQRERAAGELTTTKMMWKATKPWGHTSATVGAAYASLVPSKTATDDTQDNT